MTQQGGGFLQSITSLAGDVASSLADTFTQVADTKAAKSLTSALYHQPKQAFGRYFEAQADLLNNQANSGQTMSRLLDGDLGGAISSMGSSLFKPIYQKDAQWGLQSALGTLTPHLALAGATAAGWGALSKMRGSKKKHNQGQQQIDQTEKQKKMDAKRHFSKKRNQLKVKHNKQIQALKKAGATQIELKDAHEQHQYQLQKIARQEKAFIKNIQKQQSTGRQSFDYFQDIDINPDKVKEKITQFNKKVNRKTQSDKLVDVGYEFGKQKLANYLDVDFKKDSWQTIGTAAYNKLKKPKVEQQLAIQMEKPIQTQTNI